MASLKFAHEIAHHVSQRRAAESHGSQLLQQRAVHKVEVIGDFQNLTDMCEDLFRCAAPTLGVEAPDRQGVRHDAEQARACFIVKFGSNLAPLVLLDANQLAVEPRILITRFVEGAGQLIEPVGDRGEFLHLRRLNAGIVVAGFEFAHAARYARQRIEHAPEDEIKNRKH